MYAPARAFFALFRRLFSSALCAFFTPFVVCQLSPERRDKERTAEFFSLVFVVSSEVGFRV